MPTIRKMNCTCFWLVILILVWTHGNCKHKSGTWCVHVGSISAALSCLVYPPREERLDAWAANHVCDVFLRCFWWPQMSSDDNHWRAHMTLMVRNIWTCADFATSSFSFGPPTYFVSHYCYGRALYAVFCGKVFLKKVEQDCWLWCGKWHVRGHTYVGVHRVDTMFLFC